MDAFDIVCRLDRNDTLDEVPQNKKQKVATGLLLDKLHKQDFAGPLACRASRVLGPIRRHRVADILPHMKSVSRTGCSFAFFASSVMGSVLHKDFTLTNMITPAALDAQMNLTLSLITMMLQYCHNEILFYVN